MPDLKTKTRMISLRVSQEEYDALRRMYRYHGVGSVSALARAGMQRILGEGSRTALEERIDELAGRLDALDRKVASLTGSSGARGDE